MYRFHLAVLGGTFDILHKGHIELLNKAFSVSHSVVIGLTSDLFVIKKKLILNNYKIRFKSLTYAINKNFISPTYSINRIDNYFGPVMFKNSIDVLIASEETKHNAFVINGIRKKMQLPLMKIIIIPMVLAKDGMRISSTRIKNLEIDPDGNMTKN